MSLFLLSCVCSPILGLRYSTVSTLLQYYLLMPLPQKDVHLIYLANTLAKNSMIIFTRTVHDAQRWIPSPFASWPRGSYRHRLSIMLRSLGFPAIPLHGQLSQSARLGALGKFKAGGRSILVATDVASRYVVTFSIGTNPYQHDHVALQRSGYPLSRHRHQL